MRLFILLTGILFFIACPAYGQEDSIAPIRDIDNIYTATPKTTDITIDLSNAEEVERCLKKIHTYKYIESITFEGEGNENDLKKLLYRVSLLKNLTSISLKENELNKIPDNIGQIKSLRSLSIEGNPNLDYNDLCMHLKNTQISELDLIDNDLKKAPETISGINSLKKLKVSGNNEMDYAGLVEYLSKIPALTTLSIPLNYITDLPKNIGKLKSLQVLDVSNNNLSELPGEISGLKTINNLNIQGNLLLDPTKDLEKLKGSNLQYLSLDKEISGEELEQIKKMFPDIQIDFPLNSETEETIPIKAPAEFEKTEYKGALTAKKETSILSGAYLLYPILFQNLIYSYDTLCFEERYKSKSYENVNRIVPGRRRSAVLYMRNYCLRLEKPGLKDETWFRFATNDARLSNQYPELRAFNGMYWVYKGQLSKKQFRKKFLIKRERPEYTNIFGFRLFKRRRSILWNDVRIDFDKNNSLFNITLKCDTGFISFMAYPVIPGIPIEKSQEVYYRRYLLYKGSLLRRTQRFQRGWQRNKRSYDLNFKKLTNYAWQELQLRMSDEEKSMRKEDWLIYYDNIIANEQKALDVSSLIQAYISRSMTLRGYTLSVATGQSDNTQNNYGLKTFNADVVDIKDGSKLVVAGIYVIDNKNKTAEQSTGTLGLSPNVIPLKQFSSYTILAELRNGNWASISAEEIDKQTYDPNKVFQLKAHVFDKNLDTIGDLLKEALK